MSDPRDDIIPEPGKPTRNEGPPTNRLERICDAMTTARLAHPETLDDDKAILFMTGEGFSGMVLSGYEKDHDNEAIADLLLHLRALMKANGIEMDVLTL